MKNKISLSLFWALAVLCLFPLSPVNAFVYSQENPAPGTGSIYLSYNSTQSQGNILALDVRVNSLSGTTPAIGAAFDVNFDPAVLTYDSYLPGNFFEGSDIPDNGNMVKLVASPQAVPGTLIIGLSQNNGDPGASGSGTLLTLKFRVSSTAAQVLQSNVSLSLMNMLDLQGEMIGGLNWYDGQVVQQPLEITTASMPQGTQGSSMTILLNASGGFPPYTWSRQAGSLPPGLSLNSGTGVISGTPSQAGTYPVTIRLTDSLSQGVTRDLNMVINPSLQILTSVLDGTTVNQTYNTALSGSGGTAPLTWDIASGALPPGILLNSATGILSGTPSSSGLFSFSARVRDANGATASRNLTITVYQGISVSTNSLPETTAGAAYNSTLQAQGGAAPYTWTISSGLPAGLSLVSSTGEILGITSTAGNWGFTVTVRDLYGATATKMLAIMVNPAPSIVTASVSSLYQNSTGQGATFTATGGVSPYTWSLVSGALPAGLILDAQSGVVSGTPVKPGKYTFTVRVTDAVGITSNTAYQWVILASPPGNVDFMTSGSVNRVDGYDLIALDIALGISPASPEWNPFADLDGDGDIDNDDLIILQGNFGKSNGQ
ncbi:MAG: putative Ig domain-containing protein [Nitrospirae bacterium]|nr:putative Ig domain-containing protein [Nitrospirota bacterium]